MTNVNRTSITKLSNIYRSHYISFRLLITYTSKGQLNYVHATVCIIGKWIVSSHHTLIQQYWNPSMSTDSIIDLKHAGCRRSTRTVDFVWPQRCWHQAMHTKAAFRRVYRLSHTCLNRRVLAHLRYSIEFNSWFGRLPYSISNTCTHARMHERTWTRTSPILHCFRRQTCTARGISVLSLPLWLQLHTLVADMPYILRGILSIRLGAWFMHTANAYSRTSAGACAERAERTGERPCRLGNNTWLAVQCMQAHTHARAEHSGVKSRRQQTRFCCRFGDRFVCEIGGVFASVLCGGGVFVLVCVKVCVCMEQDPSGWPNAQTEDLGKYS